MTNPVDAGSDSVRIALAQIVSGPDPEQNLVLVEEYAARAAAGGARLVIFPEATMRCFGRSLIEIAEPLDGPWASQVQAIAAQQGIVIIAGMFTPSGDGRVRNTLLVAGASDDACYHKVHLFDAYGFAESETVAPGEGLTMINIDGLAVGLATCYDLRFSGLFTTLADRGAQLICVAASWGAGPGKAEQWDLLVRARALDSTSYVAACGQANPASIGIQVRSTAPTGIGLSTVVDPAGVVLARLGASPDLVVVDLDRARVAEVREQLPVLANRRY